jgi:uncharacterized caspase-like protein
VFSSSAGDQLSTEYDRGENGAFTEALLEGLGGKADDNADGTIRFYELRDYVRRRVKEIAPAQDPIALLPTGGVLGDPPLLVVR